MNRGEAYAVLSRELLNWKKRPYADLASRAGKPAYSHTARIGQEDITVSVRVSWVDAMRQSLEIEACADGPSCWRLERLTESVVVESASHPAQS